VSGHSGGQLTGAIYVASGLTSRWQGGMVTAIRCRTWALPPCAVDWL